MLYISAIKVSPPWPIFVPDESFAVTKILYVVKAVNGLERAVPDTTDWDALVVPTSLLSIFYQKDNQRGIV